MDLPPYFHGARNQKETETFIYNLSIFIYMNIDKNISLNKKDLIGINQEIGGNGKFHNEDSLDFALSIAKQKKSWLYELSYLSRALLVDHCFEDGNKRTSIIVIITYFENNNLDYDKDKLIKIVWTIAKKNVNDINKLMRMIKDAIVP